LRGKLLQCSGQVASHVIQHNRKHLSYFYPVAVT
jgi:hypothetical protein